MDLNHEMVEICRSKSLDATEGDALGFLRTQADGSLGGLVALQVVEHLQPDYLLAFLDTAYHKLRPGARIVLETINPACWFAFFASYIRDITHVRPIHPETLSYYVTASGFQKTTCATARRTPSTRSCSPYPSATPPAPPSTSTSSVSTACCSPTWTTPWSRSDCERGRHPGVTRTFRRSASMAAFIVALLSACAPGERTDAQTAAARGARALPFSVGESLTYDIAWAPFLTAGSATVSVSERGPDGAYRMVAEGRPTALVEQLYRVFYRAETTDRGRDALSAAGLDPERGRQAPPPEGHDLQSAGANGALTRWRRRRR